MWTKMAPPGCDFTLATDSRTRSRAGTPATPALFGRLTRSRSASHVALRFGTQSTRACAANGGWSNHEPLQSDGWRKHRPGRKNRHS
jgi:hypothetical protein